MLVAGWLATWWTVAMALCQCGVALGLPFVILWQRAVTPFAWAYDQGPHDQPVRVISHDQGLQIAIVEWVAVALAFGLATTRTAPRRTVRLAPILICAVGIVTNLVAVVLGWDVLVPTL